MKQENQCNSEIIVRSKRLQHMCFPVKCSKIFRTIHRRTLLPDLLFNNVTVWSSVTSLKRDSGVEVSLHIFQNDGNAFLQNTSGVTAPDINNFQWFILTAPYTYSTTNAGRGPHPPYVNPYIFAVYLLKETWNSLKKWPLKLWWTSNKTIIEIGNITKPTIFKSFLHLSYKNTLLLFCGSVFWYFH